MNSTTIKVCVRAFSCIGAWREGGRVSQNEKIVFFPLLISGLVSHTYKHKSHTHTHVTVFVHWLFKHHKGKDKDLVFIKKNEKCKCFKGTHIETSILTETVM